MRTRLVCLLVLVLVAVPMMAQKAPKGTTATLTLATAVNEPVYTFSFGVSQSGSIGGGGGGAGKATFEDVTITKALSKSSADRFQACAQGRHFPTATITLVDSKGNPMARVTLTDVLISGYSVSADGDGAVEKVSLISASVSYEILIGL